MGLPRSLFLRAQLTNSRFHRIHCDVLKVLRGGQEYGKRVTFLAILALVGLAPYNLAPIDFRKLNGEAKVVEGQKR